MKKTITLWIVLLLVASLFASPLVDASETVFAQDVIETPFEPQIGATAFPVPVTYRPFGDTYASRPTYSWSRKGTATSYVLVVYNIATANLVLRVTVGKANCSVTTNRCSYTPKTTLTLNKNYKWKVLAKYATGNSAYSAFRSFKVLPGFNSQFNGKYTGWLKRPGGAWKVNSTYYYTNGVQNVWSSASYNKVFKNFTYQARLKRIDTGGALAGKWASGLVVRGTPTFDPSNEWDTTYKFLYSNKGTFSVWKVMHGTITYPRPWSPTSAIVANGWNTLKVTVDGRLIRFYINGKLVWSGSDSSISSGQVGVSMVRGDSTSLVNKLFVDWATLGMSDYYKASSQNIVLESYDVPLDPSLPQVMEHSP